MRRFFGILVLLASPVLMGLGNSGGVGPAIKSNRTPGQKTGNYNLTVAGDYTGNGNGTIAPSSVSIAATVTNPGGATISLNFSSLPLVNDRFLATTSANGLVFTISGRVDLPAATDADETATQAITGRITAILSDSSGLAARVVAIQTAPSPSASGSGGN